VEEALARIARRPVVLTVAGRTDAGVHAWGQVASHDGEPVPARALNGVLPDDVGVRRSEAAPERFDARRDATSRAYCYRVLPRAERSVWERGRALWHPRPLDEAALHACASALAGRHDFTAFTPTETRHRHFERRVSSAAWRHEGDLLAFWIEADAFLRHMNRILVGTMLEVARGRHTVEAFVALLNGAPRSAAGATAPAHGLFFAGAGYGGHRVLPTD
jgi:tRNA pseudouridine38-40 synthase